ncbi:MAG: branched-chain amino acid ABC transporter permease [Desulfobacteraceae bacterium]|nr:branched-chain amino acid ABC transporter permease [Desulfobacteraceae bacterium]
MSLDAIIFQLIMGLSSAMLYWIVSVGLTFTFGVTKVLNFAHGAFYMLGAYFTLTAMNHLGNFPAAMCIGIIGAGIIGVICERLFIQRVYALHILFQLILTYGLVLIFNDITRYVWGTVPRMMPALSLGHTKIMGRICPNFSILIILLGIFIAILMYLVITKTMWGKMINALTSDIELAQASGINPNLLYASAFLLGSCLAGFGGALVLPISSASSGMGEHIIIYAFIITVMGGLGSIPGAFIAALIVGIGEAMGTLLIPSFTLAIPYLLFTAVLIVKPEGLYGEKL